MNSISNFISLESTDSCPHVTIFWNRDMKNNNTCRFTLFLSDEGLEVTQSRFEAGAAFYEISDKRVAAFSMLSLKYARMT